MEPYDESTIRKHLSIFAKPTDQRKFEQANIYLINFLQYVRSGEPATVTTGTRSTHRPDTDTILTIAHNILQNPQCSDYERHYSLQIIHGTVLTTADQIAVTLPPTAASSTLDQVLSPLDNVVNDLLTNGSRGIIEETVAVKEKIADIIAGIAERLWPQRWPNYYDNLLTTHVNENAYELLALSLHTLALNAGDNDFSNHLPSQRRSDLVQGLCTIFTGTIFPSFMELMETSTNLLRTYVDHSATESSSRSSSFSSSTGTTMQEIIQALILISTIMDMFSAFLTFLPTKDIVACNFHDILQGIWEITGQCQSTVILTSVLHRSSPSEQMDGPVYRSLNSTVSSSGRSTATFGKVNQSSFGPYFDRIYVSFNSIFMTLGNRKLDAFPELQYNLLRTSTLILGNLRSSGQEHNPNNSSSLGIPSAVNEQSYTMFRTTVTSLTDMCIRPVHALMDKLSIDSNSGSNNSTSNTALGKFGANKKSTSNTHQLNVETTINLFEAYFSELLRLLDHPSILLRATVLRSITDFITHRKFPKLAFADEFINAFQPFLITGMIKESRFCKGYVAPSSSLPGQRKTLSFEDTVHLHDFQDDETDEYYYAYEIVRTRATKCLSTIAYNFAPVAVNLLGEALENGLQMLVTAPNAPDHPTLYGGLSYASELYLWFDALATSVDPIIQSIPIDGWESPHTNINVTGAVHTILDTLLSTFLFGSNTAAKNTVTLHDPLLRTRIATMVAEFGKYFTHDSSQLSDVLDLLFSFLETTEPHPTYVQKSVQLSNPTLVTKAKELLKIELQYSRQRACHALITLGRTIPTILIDALEPLAERAMTLIAAGVLELQDTVNLIEVLVLVSNAMGTVNQANEQSSFLQDILNVAIERVQLLDDSIRPDNVQLANGAMSGEELLTFLELPLILNRSSASSSGESLTSKFAERLSTRLSSIQYLVHVLWAMNRHCSTVEYIHATTTETGNDTAPNLSNTASKAANRLSKDPHNIRIGKLFNHSAYIPGILGEKLDLPVHPFTEQYTVILGLILPLLRALYDVWNPETITTLLQDGSTVNLSDIRMVRRHILAISPEECRSLLQAEKKEALTLAANGLGEKKGKSDNHDDNDDDDDDGGEEGADGSETEQLTIVCIDNEANLSTRTVTPSVEVKELSVKLSVWYNRCLLYIHSLLHTLGNYHIISRVGRHVCALSDTRQRSPSSKSSFIPIEDTLSALYCRSGLYETNVHNEIWPMLQEYMEECCNGRNLPLRVYRLMIQQWLPGLIEGCPPLMDRIDHLGTFLTPLLSTVFETLENARNYALEIKNTEDENQSQAPRLMRTLVTIGILPPPLAPSASTAGSSTGGSITVYRDIDMDTMCEKVERDIYRGICDMIVQFIPTHDSWYVFLPYEEVVQEMNDERNSTPSSLASNGNASITHTIVTNGIVWNLDTSTKVVALPAGSPPIITRTILYHSSLGLQIARIMGNGITMMEDSLTVRKIIHTWERIISTWSYMLSLLSSTGRNTGTNNGGSSSRDVGNNAVTNECLTAWIDNAMNFYTVVIEGLCLNETLIRDTEGDIIAIITHIYCYFLFGYSSLTYFSNDGLTLLTNTPIVPNEFNTGPRDYLYTLPSVTDDTVDTLHHALMVAVSEKDRRMLFRDFLNSVTQAIDKENEKTGTGGIPGSKSGGGSLFAFGTSNRPSSKRDKVANLADKLVLLGRLSQGQGSSAVVSNEPLALSEETFIGSLFNQLVVRSIEGSSGSKEGDEDDI